MSAGRSGKPTDNGAGTGRANPSQSPLEAALRRGSPELEGDEPRRQAAVILEVLSGARGTVEASGMLGISLARYYVLEGRAIEGLVRGLGPRPKGRQLTEATRIERLEKDNARLERELARSQALVRVAQRAVGVRERKSPPPAAPRRRGRSKTLQRVERVVRTLRKGKEQEHSDGTSPAVPPGGSA